MSVQFFPNVNGQLAYEDTGSGPLVICLPSIGDVRGEYRFLAPQLVAAGYRVIQADLRGQGESSPVWDEYSVEVLGRDLLALIHHLDAGPAIVIGTSMSAAAGVWASVETPAAISALVLIGPAVHGIVSPGNKLFYRTLFARPWGPSVWTKYYTTLYPTHKPDDFNEYVDALKGNLQEKGRLESALGLMLAPKTASAERLSQVQIPVRVIMGSKDPDFKDPTAEARWVADQLHGEYHIIESAGHYPHAEMPEITGPLVIEFLRALQSEPELVHVA